MVTAKAEKFIRFLEESGLRWDCIDQAKSLVGDSEGFEKFLRRHLSPLVLDIIFKDDLSLLPPYAMSDDLWLKTFAMWKLSKGM